MNHLRNRRTPTRLAAAALGVAALSVLAGVTAYAAPPPPQECALTLLVFGAECLGYPPDSDARGTQCKRQCYAASSSCTDAAGVSQDINSRAKVPMSYTGCTVFSGRDCEIVLEEDAEGNCTEKQVKCAKLLPYSGPCDTATKTGTGMEDPCGQGPIYDYADACTS